MTQGIRLLSPEAAFLTLEMLGHVPRPDRNREAGDDGVYWKTGTSMGFRDAWSVAVFDHYVLAVWVGNFDGHAIPRSSAARARGRCSFASSMPCSPGGSRTAISSRRRPARICSEWSCAP